MAFRQRADVVQPPHHDPHHRDLPGRPAGLPSPQPGQALRRSAGEALQLPPDPGRGQASAGVAPGESFRLAAPWEPDPRRWTKMAWTDVYHPSDGSYRITTAWGRPGQPRVDTYGDMARRYGTHPESKAVGPDGAPCTRQTVGLLGRRAVTAGRIVLIGKESNRLDERTSGELSAEDLDQRLVRYEDDDEWYRIFVPRLRGHRSAHGGGRGRDQRTPCPRHSQGPSHAAPKASPVVLELTGRWRTKTARSMGRLDEVRGQETGADDPESVIPEGGFERRITSPGSGAGVVDISFARTGSSRKGWSHAQEVPSRVQAGRGGRRPAANGAPR